MPCLNGCSWPVAASLLRRPDVRLRGSNGPTKDMVAMPAGDPKENLGLSTKRCLHGSMPMRSPATAAPQLSSYVLRLLRPGGDGTIDFIYRTTALAWLASCRWPHHMSSGTRWPRHTGNALTASFRWRRCDLRLAGLGHVRVPLGAANLYAKAAQRHKPPRETLAAFAWGQIGLACWAARLIGGRECELHP